MYCHVEKINLECVLSTWKLFLVGICLTSSCDSDMKKLKMLYIMRKNIKDIIPNIYKDYNDVLIDNGEILYRNGEVIQQNRSDIKRSIERINSYFSYVTMRLIKNIIRFCSSRLYFIYPESYIWYYEV